MKSSFKLSPEIKSFKLSLNNVNIWPFTHCNYEFQVGRASGIYQGKFLVYFKILTYKCSYNFPEWLNLCSIISVNKLGRESDL